MAASDPIAGPSRAYFPPPFRIDDYQSTTPKLARHLPASSRSSTPARPISRARSLSTFSSRSAYDEDEIRLQRKRADSVKRMVSSWDLLLEKYPAISLQEDDVIDLVTGDIVEDRGRIRRMQETSLGSTIGDNYPSFAHEQEEEEQEELEIGSDEDELGLWDERSGLDPQTPQKFPEPPRSEQDLEDIDEFLRLESEQRRLQATRRQQLSYASEEEEEEEVEEEEEEDSDATGEDSWGDGASSESSSGSRQSGTEDSEDELNEDDPDATRKTPAPSIQRTQTSGMSASSRDSTSPRASPAPVLRQQAPNQLIPQAGPSPLRTSKRSSQTPNLQNLFTPPPPSQPSPAHPVAIQDLFSPSPPAPPVSSRRPGAGAKISISQGPHHIPRPAETNGAPSRETAAFKQSVPDPESQNSAPGPSIHKAVYKLTPSAPPTANSSFSDPRRQARYLDSGILKSAGRSEAAGRSGSSRPVSRTSPPDGSPVPAPPLAIRRPAPARLASPDEAPFDSLAARKGKYRHPSERRSQTATPDVSEPPGPIDDAVEPPSDEDRYYQVIHRLNPRTVRYCRTCRRSTDIIRRSRAVFCKGRTNGQHCSFARELGEAVVVVRDRNVALKERRRSMSRALTAALEDIGDPISSGRDGADSTESSIAQVPLPSSGRLRRASAAHMLRPKSCAEASDSQPSPTSVILQSIRQKRRMTLDRMRASTSTAVDINGSLAFDSSNDESTISAMGGSARRIRGESGSPGKADSAVSPTAGRFVREASTARSPRICPLCRLAGGDRSEQAGQCRGRFWTKHCPYNRANSARVTATPAPERVLPVSSGASTVQHSGPADQTPARLDPKRKRDITPISASMISGDLTIIKDQPSRSLATRLILPPSSPPTCDSSPPAIAVCSLPTPSPTVSAEPIKTTSRTSAVSSPLGRRILPLPRGSHYALQPTPPASSDGLRTPSVSGDRDRFSLNRPRSILRTLQTGQGASSTASSSLKRARFSLQPGSPSPPSSEAFGSFQSFTDGDEAGYSSSSPWRARTDDCSASDVSDSSPFSKELSIRAKDAGFKLGPGHTGRLPAGLINALFPKFGGTSTTASAQISSHQALLTRRNGSPGSGDGLPTVSPSARRQSSIGLAPTSAPKSSASATSKTAGLMLPPPLPPHRGSGTSTSMPGPETPTRSPHLSTSPVAPLIRRRRSNIVFKTVEPPRMNRQPSIPIPKSAPPAVRAQSRSRSVSVAAAPIKAYRSSTLAYSYPNKVETPMSISIPMPLATASRRHPSERKLARLARALGDEAGLEWGMDEDVDEDIARQGREGTVFMYLD